MKCPHCAVTVHVTETSTQLGHYAKNSVGESVAWQGTHTTCPSCSQKVIWLSCHSINPNQSVGLQLIKLLVWPQNSERPLDRSVPPAIATDFAEACRVLPISAQASAALTRRTLQQVLRDHAHTTSKDLYDQIEEVIQSGHLPSSLADQLSAIRIIGNFAAHPLKSKLSGLILPVEPHEAEWNLDVLEAVFDYYFTKPALAQARKDALNRKLEEAGKPLLQ